ncbi:MAG: CvpA family protein [Ferruginibacter sp.]
MLDVMIAIAFVFALIRGFRQGLIVAIFSTLAIIIGIAAALKLSAAVAVYLQSRANVSAVWLPFLSFALVFLIVVFIVNLGGKIVEKTFQMVLLGWVNRIGGMLIYTLLYAIIISVFLFYAEKSGFIKAETFKASVVYPYLQPIGLQVINGLGAIIPIFKDSFNRLEGFFGNMQDKIPH